MSKRRKDIRESRGENSAHICMLVALGPNDAFAHEHGDGRAELWRLD